MLIPAGGLEVIVRVGREIVFSLKVMVHVQDEISSVLASLMGFQRSWVFYLENRLYRYEKSKLRHCIMLTFNTKHTDGCLYEPFPGWFENCWSIYERNMLSKFDWMWVIVVLPWVDVDVEGPLGEAIKLSSVGDKQWYAVSTECVWSKIPDVDIASEVFSLCVPDTTWNVVV